MINLDKYMRFLAITNTRCKWSEAEQQKAELQHKDPFGVAPGALRAKMTSRLHFLAQPKQETAECIAQYMPKEYKAPRKTDVRISSRLAELSKPRRIPEEKVEFEKSQFANKAKWLQHLRRLKTISTPRRTPPSPLGDERVKAPLSKILPRLEKLSRPAYRPPNTNEKTFEEMNRIKPSVLKYTASDRIRQLSIAKKVPEDAETNYVYNPSKGRRTKNYTVSERTKQLSEPIFRAVPAMNVLKENPFAVNPRALKARCTRRIKRLAEPRIRY